jgi:hypothetical protein
MAGRVLPKRCIDISHHAHHRAVSRFGLSKAEGTHQIRSALREGTWYPDPDTPDTYVVVDRVDGDNACIVCAVEGGTVHVRTLYRLRNLGQLRPYKQAGGPFSVREIVDAYRRLG